MKKATIARFVIGGAAIFAAFGLAACGAETGAPEAEGVGSSEQAIGIAGRTAGYEAKFSAYITIPGDDKVLVVGGYDHTGAGIRTVKVYDKSANTWTAKASIPASIGMTNYSARGESQIALIPGTTDKFLVVGGKTSDNGTRISEPLIYDYNAGGTDAWIKPSNDLVSARVHLKVNACADKQLILSGGETSGPLETSTLEVFTYNATTPTSSSFALLKNHAGTPQTVTLATARLFHDVIPVSSTVLLFQGGEDDSGNFFGTSEKLTLQTVAGNPVCVLDNTSASPVTLPAGPALPSSAKRSRFVTGPVSLTISPNTYSFLLAGGTSNGSDAPTTTYALNSAGTAWTGTSTPSLVVGHILPAYAVNTTGDFALVGGLNASGNSITDVDYFSSTAFGAGTSLTTSRYAAWAAYIGSTYMAGMGETVTGGGATETWLTSVE